MGGPHLGAHGAKSLLKLLRRKHGSIRRTGVCVSVDGWAWATVSRRGGDRPLLESCNSSALVGSDADDAISAWISSDRGSFGRLSAVLDSTDYQLLQVEAPDVLPAELRAAIRWRLKDMIDFPVEDAVVDVFGMPDQPRRKGSKMMYAVAARHGAVAQRVAQLKSAGSKFDVVDVPEMALRNLAAQLPQAKDGLIFLWLQTSAAQLLLVKADALYLTRRVAFRADSSSADAPSYDVDAIALELQRSMDYFESHYEQAPIGHLVIAPAQGSEALARALRSETPLKIHMFELSHAVQVQPGVIADDASALLAVGAALRHETKSL
jgi:MSHA biogenesis protein MshI